MAIGGASISSYANYKTLAVGGGTSGGVIDFKDSGNVVRGELVGDSTGLNVSGQAGVITFSAQSAGELMRLNSTGLGIGTSSPSYKLDVTGGVVRSQSASGVNNGYLITTNSSNSGARNWAVLANSNVFGDFVIRQSNTLGGDPISGTDKLVIDNAGNVGIGTSSPSSYGKLAVAGNAALNTNGQLKFYNSANNNWSYIDNPSTDSTAFMRFAVGSGEAMRLDASGNLGIGTSSPSVKLQVAGGDIGLDIDKKLILRTSDPTASFLYYTASTTIRTHLESQYGVFIGRDYGGGNGLFLDVSGNLGLGVTPPSADSGKIYVGPTKGIFSTGDGMNVYSNAYYNGSFKYSSTGYAVGYYQYAGQHVWQTAPSGTAGNAITFTQAMTLDASGNLLVGATSGSSKLVVGNGSGNVATPTAIQMDQTYGTAAFDKLKFYLFKGATESYGFGLGALAEVQYWAGSSSTGTHVWYTSQTERARIDSSGRLGLGLSSPNAWLDVSSGASSAGGAQIAVTGEAYGPNSISARSSVYDPAGTILRITATTNSVNTGALINFNAYNSSAGATGAFIGAVAGPNTNGAANTVFGTRTGAQAWAENARIDYNGNLLLNTTSQNGSAKLTVRGASGGSDCIAAVQQAAGGYCYVTAAFSNGGTYYHALFQAGGTTVGSITSSASVTSYNVTSDQRLKENIQDADSASSLIDALQVRKFDWKTDQTHQRYGFIAQELVTVAPEAVHQPIDTEEMMAVDYSKLVPMLVKEIQSLRKRLADAGIA
jgi:hypothetical protein